MLQPLWLADLDPARPHGVTAERASEDRHRLPLLLGRARRRAVPRPRPGRGAARVGHEVSVLAPADDDTPLPPYVVPAGRAVPVPLQRLGGPAELRPAVGRPGAAVAARGRLRRAAHPRAGHAVAVACSPAGRRRADRRDLPHLEPALPGDERGLPDPASRRWRRSARGSRCPRTPGGRSSSTSAATRCSSRTASSSTGSRRPSRAGVARRGRDARLPRPDGRAAQGPAGAARRAGRGARRPGPGCGCWSPVAATREEAVEDLARDGPRRAVDVPRAW